MLFKLIFLLFNIDLNFTNTFISSKSVNVHYLCLPYGVRIDFWQYKVEVEESIIAFCNLGTATPDENKILTYFTSLSLKQTLKMLRLYLLGQTCLHLTF